MKKADAEKAIRHLAWEWAQETGSVSKPGYYPNFSSLKSWLEVNRYGHYLGFRSRCGADYDAEHWLEDELKAKKW